jgi:predicted nucleic acid-binding protein
LIVSHFTALYDACVLYPAPLRDLLVELATTGLFRAKWSDEIHEEWIRNLLEDRKDLCREQLERTRGLMNASVLDCLVTGYEELIPALTLPDPNDRHVLAAAIRSRTDVIVTSNLKDFPSEVLTKYGMDAQHPDEFIKHLLNLAPHAVCEAAKNQRQRLKNPPKTVDDYLAGLERQGLAQTVNELRSFAALL